MADVRLARLIDPGEGEACEFKESLASVEGAIDALVAFANKTGGHVLFGVRDNGEVTGVTVGANTIEGLANQIVQQTYPSLPVEIEQIIDDGRTVVAVYAPPDRPPLVGAYLKSSRRLAEGEVVPTEHLQAYRRVGKTNQRFDFMLMRADLPSDPGVVLWRAGAVTRGPMIPLQWYFNYSNDGPGWAHNLGFTATHPVYRFSGLPSGLDLPPAALDGRRANPRDAGLRCENADVDGGLVPIRLVARYGDSRGMTWTSGLQLHRRDGETFETAPIAKRIVEFPSKAALVGG